MRHERGFTLLEVLVAFIVAALALAALSQGALGGLRASQVAGHEQEAVSRARSRLAVIGHAAPITASDSEGDDGGGFHWRVRVEAAATAPVAAAAAGAGANGPQAVLYRVTVAESWTVDGGVRAVTLSTYRVGTAPPAPP